ncbi:MAG: UDP-N-acetylglucosamine 2-epimerase (non-hydrolyzing) [Actinomycetota bacterium]|nr:UDP-N-acetylglucosamine 2-epimerase (non-hydrolyzing) [Actinomycetota bacterium]
MRIVHVVGTRPNFVKMAPVIAAARERFGPASNVVVHTGQHYDTAMSDIFFEELGVPKPDHMLGVGSGSHAEQAARVLERLEPVLREVRPDLVLVPGDVNSSMAAALCAARVGVPLGHVESGLRSFDRGMPEEINRIVIDHLSEFCFLHSEEAQGNLADEGVPAGRARFVGNTMIDTLVALEERIRSREAASALGLLPGSYLLVTLHRPALVDGPLLREAMTALAAVAQDLPVVFPVHPRTRARLAGLGFGGDDGISLAEPVGYLDFLSLEAEAAGVLTDSGGIQEETTYLGIPCFTLRDNTERPVTVRAGTNTLMGLDPARIAEIPSRLAGARRSPQSPPLWDGKAARRIADVIAGW